MSQNARRAAQLYARRWPDHVAPTPKIFKRLENALCSKWPANKRKRNRTATSVANEVEDLAQVNENPHMGQIAIARQVGISESSVCRILKINQFHPYHLQLVLELRPTD
ncbi:hypothetical protein Zmor_021252 [Zophobas morio]|uniref:DUF4817 domain-containing protein n=1 Tax=Zophobas morio TaxID=2755281 RepID=A0AA38I853_9CUCU|nr:hypothetical protein Zmor_021252 [Zophobas morio]